MMRLSLVLLLVMVIGGGLSTKAEEEVEKEMGFLPAAGTEFGPAEILAGDHQPFTNCGACNCCAGGDRRRCQTMKCCFRINCNIPGKPFGTCSYQPFSCDCNSCG